MTGPLFKNPDGSSPAPLPANERERLEVLRGYGVLDTLPETAFDDITFLASYVCQTPVALITLVDRDRQWFKSRIGVEAEETHRDLAFCAHAILQPDELLEVEDTRQDERFNTHPFVTGDASVRFYGGVPLVTPEGAAIGTICTLDRVPRKLTDEQKRALRALGREVVTQLELRRTINQLRAALAALKVPTREGGVDATSSLREADDATQRARSLMAQATAGEDLEGRIRSLLGRMESLQKKSSR